MSDGFDQMIATGRSFFAGLARNNEKDWFEANKASFKDGIEAPAKLLVELFAEDLSRLTGVSHSGKVGRIYRDTRFSADKTPYNTYLHAYWESSQAAPGWLFRLTATGPELLTGLHGMDSAALTRFRAAVDRDGDALEEAIAEARAGGADIVDMGPEPLKRVPKPYAPDHEHEAHLRRKMLALGGSIPDSAVSRGLMAALNLTAMALLPFWRWCDRAMR
jgi:uncharacterized protein (TIGR02453 family)